MKQKTQDIRERITELLNEGTAAKDVAVIVDCSVPFVYLVAKESGFTFERKSRLDCNVENIKKEIANGATFAELARMFNVSKHTVINFCKARGIENTKYQERFEESIPQLVDANTFLQFEYVGGYTKSDGTVECRCRFCGMVSTITWQSVRKHKAVCRYCKTDERERANKQKKLKRQTEIIERQERKRIEKEERESKRRLETENKIHPCPVCGTMTDRRVYCSDKCANKADNKRRDVRRRKRIQTSMVDADITVESLFRRDGGVCYLCGKTCRLDDYIVRDGTFIAGDWYPSIDHVIPLAHGGSHSWNNVRLAHRLCNSIKGAKYPPSST